MAELGSEIFFAGIAELNRMVRAKETTAVDLARAFGRRLETLGPRYNALALPLTERAIRQAKAVDAGDQARAFARPAARHPVRRQGSAERGRTDHHLGRASVRRAGFRLRRHGDPETGERRRAAGGQTGHGGTGRRAGLPLRFRVADRAGAESLGPHAAGPAARRADRRSPWPPVWRRSPSARRRRVPS